MPPKLEPYLFVLAQTLILFVVFWVVETTAPIENQQRWRSKAFNVGLTVLAVFVAFASMQIVVLAQNVLPHVTPLLTVSSPSNWLEGLGCECLFLLIFDFFVYWLHRLQHTSPTLWKWHKWHHSDDHLNVSTTGRHHWTENAIRSVFVILPMTMLFDLPVGVASFGIALAVLIPLFSHLNLRLELGACSPLFVGPQLHRIHHSIEKHHYNKNFANFFPLWDIVFGTYYNPSKGEFPRTGIKS